MKKLTNEIEQNHNSLNNVIQSFKYLKRSISSEKINFSLKN